MDGFQSIVLYSAIIILIIILVVVGVTLSYAKDDAWPPMVPNCPDYWEIDGSGNDAKCVDIKDLSTKSACPPTLGDKNLKMNFNVPAFSGANGRCAKYNWANKCGVAWDGINYGVNNPCQTAV